MARTPGWNINKNSPVDKLFNNFNQSFEKISHVVNKGSIIAFSYVGQSRRPIHDPYPLIIVADIFSDSIRGVNLHYLTLPYVQNMVTQHANNTRFSYAYIKQDDYIVGAFRTYKRPGISQLRILDAGFLRNLLSVVRALNPGELDAIKDQIRKAIQDNQPNQPIAQPGPEIK